MIAGGVIKVDRNGERLRVGHILRGAVRHGHNLAVGDAIDRLIVAEIALVLVLRTLPRRGHAANRLDLHPVDGEALRNVRTLIEDQYGAAMGGVRRVAHRIASDPLPAQGRPDPDRTLARHRSGASGISFASPLSSSTLSECAIVGGARALPRSSMRKTIAPRPGSIVRLVAPAGSPRSPNRRVS